MIRGTKEIRVTRATKVIKAILVQPEKTDIYPLRVSITLTEKMVRQVLMARTDSPVKTVLMAILPLKERTISLKLTRLRWCPMSLRLCLSTMVRWWPYEFQHYC